MRMAIATAATIVTAARLSGSALRLIRGSQHAGALSRRQ
jgi:hypothetical protein